MNISENGLNLVKQFEGCKLTTYRCPAGVLTIGWGHTANVKPGQKITQEQADNLLKQDMKVYEKHVNTIVKIPLNQNQFDALVSFCYNCGSGNLKTLVNGRNVQQIANAIPLYNKSNGKVLNGLVRRRKAEQELFNKPITQNKVKKVKVTATALNVRTGIGTSYKVVKVLNKNIIVDVLATSNGWGKIKDGYISLKYTEEV